MIGLLNKRITLQYQTKVSDSMGGWVLSWVDHATVWAAIWDATSHEINAAGQTSLVITHRIRIRYRSTFKASWRIKFGTRYFAIVSILNPNEKCEWLDILCKEAA